MKAQNRELRYETILQLLRVSNDGDDMSNRQLQRLQFFINQGHSFNEKESREAFYYFNMLRRNAKAGKIITRRKRA